MLTVQVILVIVTLCYMHTGQSAELILIGYDGIALPPLLFPHQPSFFLFLECLENSLLPQGCLEPPLWYIKDKTSKVRGQVGVVTPPTLCSGTRWACDSSHSLSRQSSLRLKRKAPTIKLPRSRKGRGSGLKP